MSLASEVQTRISDQRLTEITNTDNRDATTPNVSRLDAASDDIENAWFPRFTGIAYDNTELGHIAVAVDGVEALLIRRNGQTSSREIWDNWAVTAESWGKIQGRKRVVPVTSSKMIPSKDDRLTSTPRPAFDDRRWDGYIADAPSGGVGTVEHFG